MLRLRPLFWATFLPGSSTVPAALAVIFRTRSFSSLYTPWLLARPVASLCRKSLRTLASCIRSRDILPFSLCQLDENLTLRASLCCSFASLSRMPSKALTGSISWPTEVAANTATPRSMPIGSSVDFDGSGLFFCHKTLTNHSPAFRRKVTERRSPPRGRYPRKRTQPILGSLMAPWRLLSRLNSTSSAGTLNPGPNGPGTSGFLIGPSLHDQQRVAIEIIGQDFAAILRDQQHVLVLHAEAKPGLRNEGFDSEHHSGLQGLVLGRAEVWIFMEVQPDAMADKCDRRQVQVGKFPAIEFIDLSGRCAGLDHL